MGKMDPKNIPSVPQQRADSEQRHGPPLAGHAGLEDARSVEPAEEADGGGSAEPEERDGEGGGHEGPHHAEHGDDCCEILGMFFGSVLPEIWIPIRAIFLDETNRSRSKANSRRRFSVFAHPKYWYFLGRLIIWLFFACDFNNQRGKSRSCVTLPQGSWPTKH